MALLSCVWGMGILVASYPIQTLVGIIVIALIAPVAWKNIQFSGSPVSRLTNQIKKHKPFNQQEDRDKQLILRQMKREPDILLQKNDKVHFSVSAWVMNQERTKVLMLHDDDLKSWSWFSTHADGEAELLDVALKEVLEKSDRKEIDVLYPEIFSLEVLGINGYMKNREYVTSHIHLNVTFVFQAYETEEIKENPDGVNGAAWIDKKAVKENCNEPWMLHIYYKLMERSKELPYLERAAQPRREKIKEPDNLKEKIRSMEDIEFEARAEALRELLKSDTEFKK